MEEAASLAVMQTIYSEKATSAEMEQILLQKCQESLRDRLVAVESMDLQVKAEKSYARVELKATMKMINISFPGGKLPFGEITTCAQSDCFSPEQIIRKVRKGEKLTEWIGKRTDK